jgi:hypothetical protein
MLPPHYSPYVFDVDAISAKLAITNNKQRLSSWVVGWPISAIEHVSSDMLHHGWTILSGMLGGLYNRIASNIVESAVTELQSSANARNEERNKLQASLEEQKSKLAEQRIDEFENKDHPYEQQLYNKLTSLNPNPLLNVVVDALDDTTIK